MSQLSDEQPRRAKCSWCNKPTPLYYDQVDGHYHFMTHDWRAGEQCANSGKTVYESEIKRGQSK